MQELVEKLTKMNKTISTMESCTGGGVSNAITNIEGASQVIKFSAVTYCNEFKTKMGVNPDIIDKYSVYSIEVAHEMALKISSLANSDFGIGITGKLNSRDKNNNFGKDNEVFVSIYYKNVYYDMVIAVDKENRKQNKDVVINKIAEKLNEILCKEELIKY